MAPQEGAFAWLDGLSLPVGATNFDEAYEFLNYIYDSEVNGLIANETGYNPVSTGAENYLAPDAKKAFGDAYPGDALDRLWWWPPSARSEDRRVGEGVVGTGRRGGSPQ